MAEKQRTELETTKPTLLKNSVRPNKTVLLIVLWVAVLFIIGFVSFTVSRNNALAPNRAAEDALAAIKNNDDKKIYELGTESFKKTSTKERVKTVVNEWSPVLSKATKGEPQVVSKQQSTKDNEQSVTLVYKYDIQPGKSKINQKEFYVRVILENTSNGYKVSAYNFDVQKKDSKK